MNKRIALVFVPVGIGINIVGGMLATSLKLPVFLDTIGTILAAAILGPWWGALTGGLTNVIMSLQSPMDMWFAIVNIAVGLIVGFVSMKFGFQKWLIVLVTGLILAVVAPIIGTIIATYVYGGLTGGGIDIFTAGLMKAGAGSVRRRVHPACRREPGGQAALGIRCLGRHSGAAEEPEGLRRRAQGRARCAGRVGSSVPDTAHRRAPGFRAGGPSAPVGLAAVPVGPRMFLCACGLAAVALTGQPRWAGDPDRCDARGRGRVLRAPASRCSRAGERWRGSRRRC